MQAPELPPFHYQLMKDRTTKEQRQVLENCRNTGLLLGEGGFVRSDDPIFCACVPPRNHMPTFCWMY
jgi:hypothetical protein